MKSVLFIVFVALLLATFAYGETQVLGTKAAVRKLARRSRGLIRRISHRAAGRRLHGRTRSLLRRLLKRLHTTLHVVTIRHGSARTIAERRKYTKLLLIIAQRLKSIGDRMNVIQEERVSVQPTVNLHGQVNLAQIRAGYLKKMQEAILLLGSRYKAIIKKIKAEKSNGSDEKVRQALIKLRERVKLIKSKLQGVKKQYDAAKAQVKKEKAETRAIRANIKKVKTDAAKIISDLRAEIRKLRDAVKKAADRSDLLKTIAKLKTDIKAVHESVKSQLEKHRKELSEKLRALHAQWTKKRQELEDAWKRKKSAMEKAWGRERQKYRDQIRDLKKRNGKCGASEIYNIRLKRCVKLYQNRAPKRPNTVRPSQRLGQFTDQLKQTKDVVNKMNTAIKKMAEMERN